MPCNKKATIVRHLLKKSRLKTTNTNTSNYTTQPKYITLNYGGLARGNPYHWVLKATIGTGHAKYLGFSKNHEKIFVRMGAFLLQGDLYELDAVALTLLNNVHNVMDQVFLCGTIDIKSENIEIYEDMDATPKCGDLVIRVEAYFANCLSTQGLSTFMT